MNMRDDLTHLLRAGWLTLLGMAMGLLVAMWIDAYAKYTGQRICP